MIVSGQISREEAMKELQEPMYDESMMIEYIMFIKKKLHISDDEFNEIMSAPTHEHEDFKCDKLSSIIRKIIKE